MKMARVGVSLSEAMAPILYVGPVAEILEPPIQLLVWGASLEGKVIKSRGGVGESSISKGREEQEQQ